MNTQTESNISASGTATNSLEKLIQDVAKRADISETNAEHVVDMVLTSVKTKLPNRMASKLVAVMSGEDSFAAAKGSADDRHSGASINAENISEKLGDVGENLTRVGGQAFEDATRIGGKAFEEVGKVSSKVVGDATVAAGKLSQWAKETINKQRD